MKQLDAPAERYIVSPHAVFERINDEAVILDTRSELYLALNASGTCIWDALSSGESVDETARRLATSFSVSPERARVDAIGLVRELLDRKLIQPRA